jgi:bifunctional DNA-binding transcriptional regulator/antitoxin component of YhaV-PrlF toxin-antitoxin module
MERFTVAVDGSGRILLPAKLRKQLKLKKGTELIARVNEEQLVLQTRLQALRDAQAYFSKFRPAGRLWSEELIKERRKEARRELKR